MRRSESLSSLLVPWKKHCRHALTLAFLFALEILASRTVAGQTPPGANPSDVLHQLNSFVEQLIRRVSPTVVQIQVTGYGTTDDSERGMTRAIIGRRRAIGSGVIVDPEGYIVTNAHVVNGAESIEMIVPARIASTATLDDDQDSQAKSYQAHTLASRRRSISRSSGLWRTACPRYRFTGPARESGRVRFLCFWKLRGFA